jgi:hypothetical protein
MTARPLDRGQPAEVTAEPPAPSEDLAPTGIPIYIRASAGCQTVNQRHFKEFFWSSVFSRQPRLPIGRIPRKLNLFARQRIIAVGGCRTRPPDAAPSRPLRQVSRQSIPDGATAKTTQKIAKTGTFRRYAAESG